MANQLQFKYGLAANRTSVTPIVGEPIFTSDDKKLYVGDGISAGGVSVVMGSDVSVTSSPNKIPKLTSSGKIDDSLISSTFATVTQLDSAVAGLDFQQDVNAVQVDATLIPELVLGRRYIITSPTTLHAAFGTIQNLGQNDIVQYNGTSFVVTYDVSAKGSGSLCWVIALNLFYFWDGSSWREHGGLTGITAGNGLTKTGNTINAVGTADRITVLSDSIDISSTYVGQASITTVGTIVSGTWNATALADAYIASSAVWNAKLGANSTIDGGVY